MKGSGVGWLLSGRGDRRPGGAPDDEQFWPGQPRELYELIEAPKTLLAFSAAEGANSHCEPLAPVLRSHRFLDWLDQVFA